MRIEEIGNLLFLVGLATFVIHPNSKLEQTTKKIICLPPAGTQISRNFKVHDLITCESKVEVAVLLQSKTYSRNPKVAALPKTTVPRK